MNPENIYDTIAEHFDRTRYKPWDKCREFINKIPENSIALDIGCGNGRHLKLLAERNLTAIGIDTSVELLKICKKKIKSAFLIKADAVNLPFKNSSVDNIIYIAVLHHLPTEKDRAKSLNEIRRVLKKRGTALITVWAKEQERFENEKSQDVHVTWNKKYKRFYHLFRKGELEKSVKNTGFKILQSFREGDNYYVKIKKTSDDYNK